jgi:hypothetical protein
VGSGKRWFVGDLGAWQEDPHKDKALLGSMFGCVWVGYVGEEAEEKQALRWGMLQWAWAFLWTLILLLVLRVSSEFLGWIVGLLLRVCSYFHLCT